MSIGNTSRVFWSMDRAGTLLFHCESIMCNDATLKRTAVSGCSFFVSAVRAIDATCTEFLISFRVTSIREAGKHFKALYVAYFVSVVELGILVCMRIQFPVVFLIAVLFSGWYFYREAHPCIFPLPYSIGSIDERFNLDANTVKKIMVEAEMVWEEALGRQLFTYANDASFKIDFTYDDRQERSESAEAQKEALDQKENISKSINKEYAKLLTEYDQLKDSYESKVAAYNKRLATFNATVASYNQKGGAPADVYQELQKTERGLKNEESALEAEAAKLSVLAKNINEVSARGNDLISEYNEGVVEYNQTYTGGEEFTQGEYNGDSITVFHFKDQTELKNVLIHELGHAIGLPHVEGGESIMYYLMDKQPATSQLSESDLAALGKVCKPNESFSTRFHQFSSSLFSKLHLI